MGDPAIHSRARRALLMLLPGAAAGRLLASGASPQGSPAIQGGMQSPAPEPHSEYGDGRLPNGKLQKDEILKADYAKNLKESRELVDLAESFEEDLEKNDKYVFSLATMKKLDEMEKLVRRMRDRLRHT